MISFNGKGIVAALPLIILYAISTPKAAEKAAIRQFPYLINCKYARI
jgi:hypothetical protein